MENVNTLGRDADSYCWKKMFIHILKALELLKFSTENNNIGLLGRFYPSLNKFLSFFNV